MGRTAGRTPQDTRRLILTAAGDVIRTRGTLATLDDIAGQAGVSKGGLLYHFASKDELLRALTTDIVEQARGWIEDELDPADTAPGRYTRAYVRALFGLPDKHQDARKALALLAQLTTVPAIEELIRVEHRQTTDALHADGLPADVLALVVAATEGAQSTQLLGVTIAAAQLEELKQRLIEITYDPQLWHGPGRSRSAEQAG